jgi:HK97 family phage major capsid protein/HK97 family phage prohead protease
VAKLAPGAKLPVQYRSFDIDRAKVDPEKRTLELSFASEHPVERWFGKEVLKVTPDAVDLSRLNPGGALLINHDSDLLVGTVVSARVDGDRVARASVKFGRSPKAEEEFQNVLDGIRTKVSFGYRVNKMVKESEDEGVETFRVTSFTPFEISLVSVPADPTVGIGREHTNEEFEVEIEDSMRMQNRVLLDPAAPTAAGAPPAAPAAPPPAPTKGLSTAEREQLRRSARQEEQNRIREINAIAEKINHPSVYELAEEFTASERSLDEFRAAVLESEVYKATPVSAAESGLLGMSEKEIEEYSLTRAILRRGEGRPLDGIEREASDALAKKIRRNPNGFFVPADVAIRGFGDSKRLGASERQRVMDQVRALTSNVHSAGGALVGTDLMGSSLIDLLRNAMFVMQMGARSLTGLVGDVAIPRQTGGATAYWLGQGAALTRTQQVVDQLALSPHRLAAATAYDKQLLAQSSLSVEAFVREDLTAILALEKDRVALNGSGAAGEPLGILNTSGLSTLVTFATAAKPLFTDYILMETNLAANNADRGRLGYLVTPAVRGWSKGTAKFASTGTPIWENDMVNGYPAKSTNQVPTAKSVVFGRWDDLIIADWDGLDVVVDPFSLSLNGQISVVIQTLTDVGIRHTKSFTNSTN